MRTRLGLLALSLFFLGSGVTCGGASKSSNRESTSPSTSESANQDASDAPIVIHVPLEDMEAQPTTELACTYGSQMITACEYDAMAAVAKSQAEMMEIMNRHMRREIAYLRNCRSRPLSEQQARDRFHCLMGLRHCSKLSSCLGDEYKPGPNNMRPLELVPMR